MTFSKELLTQIEDLVSEIKQFLYGQIDISGNSMALDVGCAYGNDLFRLGENITPDTKLFGIDVDEKYFFGSNKYSDFQNIDFFVGDAQELPFCDNVFDVVWADRLLQHVKYPQRAVSEIRRVLNVGGRCVLADADHYSASLSRIDSPLARKLMHVRADKFKCGSAGIEIEGWCKEVGLNVVNVEEFNILVKNTELAKKVGLFYDSWDKKHSQTSEQANSEIEQLYKDIEKYRVSGEFKYESKMYVISAVK